MKLSSMPRRRVLLVVLIGLAVPSAQMIAQGARGAAIQGRTLDSWTAQLRDPSPRLRSTAAGVVARFGGRGAAAVPVLTALLADSVSYVRVAAIDALGAIGAEAAAAVPALTQRLGALDVRERGNAAHAIGRIGTRDTVVIGQLIGLLEKDDYAEQQATYGLRELGTVALPQVTAALASPQLLVRRGAAGVLADHDSLPTEVLPALIAALHTPDAQVRRAILTTLGRMGPRSASAAPVVGGLLNDEEIGVSAANSLAVVGPAGHRVMAEQFPTLRRSARISVVRALGDSRNPEVVPALIPALGDPDPMVRSLAVSALKGFGPRAVLAAPALGERTTDPDERVRGAVYAAQAAIGPSIDSLKTLLGSTDVADRKWAAAHLQRIQPAGLELAEIALGDSQEAVREAAVLGIGQLGPSALPLLERALKDRTSGVRQLAVLALDADAMRPVEPQVLAILAKLKTHSDPLVRSAAANMQGKITTRRR